MMPPMRTTLWGLVVLAAATSLAGCGKEVMGGGDDGPGTMDDASTSTPDAWVPPAGYTKLIGRSWSLPVGAKDIYRCVRVTIPADTYITSIIAQAPNGTHHTVLSIAGANGTAGPDGEQDCCGRHARHADALRQSAWAPRRSTFPTTSASRSRPASRST